MQKIEQVIANANELLSDRGVLTFLVSILLVQFAIQLVACSSCFIRPQWIRRMLRAGLVPKGSVWQNGMEMLLVLLDGFGTLCPHLHPIQQHPFQATKSFPIWGLAN
ncbi:MAG: hypothetical protein ACI9HK_002693 [Pirellulaceae bacterium]|jgi:hypothetical protein